MFFHKPRFKLLTFFTSEFFIVGRQLETSGKKISNIEELDILIFLNLLC